MFLRVCVCVSVCVCLCLCVRACGVCVRVCACARARCTRRYGMLRALGMRQRSLVAVLGIQSGFFAIPGEGHTPCLALVSSNSRAACGGWFSSLCCGACRCTHRSGGGIPSEYRGDDRGGHLGRYHAPIRLAQLCMGCWHLHGPDHAHHRKRCAYSPRLVVCVARLAGSVPPSKRCVARQLRAWHT